MFGWRETRMYIDWHDPDLYFSLALLAGVTALVAIIDELRARKPGWWNRAKPLDGLRRDRSRPMKTFALKPVALLAAVAALAFAVLAWHVVPAYVSLLAFTSNLPQSVATGSACRCVGCGCKGGPGWRGQNGQCVSHASLTRDCGSPPSARCTYEGTRQVCTRN